MDLIADSFKIDKHNKKQNDIALKIVFKQLHLRIINNYIIADPEMGQHGTPIRDPVQWWYKGRFRDILVVYIYNILKINIYIFLLTRIKVSPLFVHNIYVLNFLCFNKWSTERAVKFWIINQKKDWTMIFSSVFNTFKKDHDPEDDRGNCRDHEIKQKPQVYHMTTKMGVFWFSNEAVF